jgi:hypothetical protein
LRPASTRHTKRSQFALKMEPMIAEKAKQQQLSTLKQNTTVLPTLTKRTDPIDTRSEIATIANVSTGTMAKVKKIINTATPETIQKLNAGEITINQAYKDVKREDNMSKTESLAKEIRGQEWLTSIIASAKDHHDLEATLLSINDSIPVNRLKLDLSGIDYRLLHETLTRKQ